MGDPEFIKTGFSKRLARLIEGRQEEFEKLSGVPQPSLSAYKKNERVPSAAAVLKIANAAGVSAQWLLTGEEVGPGAPREVDLTIDFRALRDAIEIVDSAERLLRDEEGKPRRLTPRRKAELAIEAYADLSTGKKVSERKLLSRIRTQ